MITTLETLNLDVLRLIMLELQKTRTQGTLSLQALTLCSRTLRDIVYPVLFYRYRIHPEHLPPERIRRFIEHINLQGTLGGSDSVWLGPLLDSLPSLSTVTFRYSTGIACDVLKLIFSYPRIVSITFAASVSFGLIDSYPVEELAQVPISITHLSYFDATLWSEFKTGRRGPQDLNTIFSREAKILAALVSATYSTLADLTLPMQSAPILLMATLSWPRLRSLSLSGHYLTSDQAESLPVLLSSLPHLQTLSLLIAREDSVSRAPVLGHHASPSTVLSGLHSLTLAYPDPEDSIFSVDTTALRHLSLRDWPRHYTYFTFENDYTSSWASPILSSDECLSILQRMDLPQITSLELVYEVQGPGSDDNLLSYVAHTLPKLSYFELHRYRANSRDPLDYMHVVELAAAAAPHAHVMRLNLDFPEDHGPHCSKHPERDAWFAKFKGELGPNIVALLEERCPLLEHVGLLYHGVPTSTWVEFHPSRCAEPRFVLDDKDPERWDSPPIPSRWYEGLEQMPLLQRRRREAAPP